MRELPILFSTPMVQAILDGRKSMTRRVIKPQPDKEISQMVDWQSWLKCPYGQPGDHLWVRETWAEYRCYSCLSGSIYAHRKCHCGIVYKADKDRDNIRWKPSIHIPKEAARIWLEVTNVGVERLQEITEEDAKAEGFVDSWDITNNRLFCTARENFEGLWNTLNLKRGYGWEANPWVWVIEFKKVTPCD